MALMTYDEAAAALGITPGSVRRTARRKRWNRIPGNDGCARVEIPDDLLAKRHLPEGSPQDSPADSPEGRPDDHAAMLARLEVEIAGLKAVVDAERARADAEARRADAAERDRDRWHELAVQPWWRRLVG